MGIWAQYDQLGRESLNKDSYGDYQVETLYYTPQASGLSYKAVSNPYLTGSETTAGWTVASYDTSGRISGVQHIAGSALPMPWGSNGNSTGTASSCYAANSTTATDEAGVSRTSYVDGLGRLTSVTENGLTLSGGVPNPPPPCGSGSGNVASTPYSYDALDNLTSVMPPAGCGVNSNSACTGRSFNYSSLKRRLSATNPESGTIGYTYDANGNLKTRASGGITTTFNYDALDELTSKTYTDSTPAASYSYSHGWRTSATSGNTTYAYNAFDGLGRVTSSTQTTNGVPYPFSYLSSAGATGYNLMDEVTSMTTPAGTKIATTYNQMGVPEGVNGQTAAGFNAANAFVTALAPNWAVTQISLGNTLTEQTCYNDHQQPYVIRQRTGGSTHAPACQPGMTPDSYDVGFLSFAFPTLNNGNISSQTIQYAAAPGYSAMSFVQGYTYDEANRIASVTESSSSPWSQTFGYDVAGNRWLQNGAQFDPSTPLTGSINPFDANNHLNSAGYDARGNQTGDGGYGFQYDAENRLTSSSMSGSALATYTYDADDRRVTEVAGAETTTYVYNLQGELAAEYTSGATTTPCATTCYLMTDHLGSTRMQTDASGNQIQLFDYAPFGEGLGGAGGRDGRWAGYQQSGIHFTGKEQEGYEGAYMHYFGARYFSGGLGRFMNPDEPLADQNPSDPQSWNLYSYVRNRSLSSTDPDGTTTCDENGDTCHDSVTVNGGSGDEVAYAWATLRRFASEGAQGAANAANGTLQAINDFRKNSNCTGTLVAVGASIGATVVGAQSAEAGAALGLAVGAASGPGAFATAAGGAALFGAAGSAVGYWAGSGLGSVAGGAICASSTGGGGGGGGGLGGAARKKLGNLADRAGEKVRDVIRSRGGTASNVNQAGIWADRTLGEAAQAAANGDPAAETAIKIAKQAGRLGQRY